MNIFFADYERLSREMESNFLALGKSLYIILKQSQSISEKAAKVSSQIGGFELNKAMDSLKLFQEQIGSMDVGSKHRSARLSGILDAFGEVDGHREYLRQSVESLSHIFFAANDEVLHDQRERSACEKKGILDLKDMEIAIYKKSNEFGSRISEIREEIKKSMVAALQAERQRSHQSNIILDQILSGIETLRDKQRISADILHHFSIRYQAIFKNIGDIVECLQFHDITRQQIQHSSSAIKEIESQLMNPSMIGGTHRIENVVAISQIQVIQLCQAKAGLEYAARTIKNNLENLSFDIHEIITAAKNLGELTGKHGESFLDNIERNLSSLQNVAKDFLYTKKELLVFPVSVPKNMEELSVIIQDIMNIGSRIKSTTNSIVGDESISGTSESSPGCLTMDVRNHVTEMENRAHHISKRIHSIASSMGELNRTNEADTWDPLNEIGTLDREFEVMIQQLHAGNNYAEGALAEVEILSAALLEDVIKASRFFKHPEVLLQEIEKVCMRLEEHIQKAKAHIPSRPLWESRRNRSKTNNSDMTNENDNVFISDDEFSEPCLNETNREHATEMSDNKKGCEIGSKPFGGNIELF
jgi:hypothetical protein